MAATKLGARSIASLSFTGTTALLSAFLSVPAAPARAADDAPSAFRVCADPNNLPFSNRRQEGFENELAEMLARELGLSVAYTWWPQRRGFLRNTLNAGRCDVVMGIPAAVEMVLTTRPYYRSSYAFVYPADAAYTLHSLDDKVLRGLTIGVHLIGDDYTNSPPAHALSARGLVDNVVGYSVFGNYAEESPPGQIVEAVAAREIDVAIVWGPIAGYFAQRHAGALQVVPVETPAGSEASSFAYDIALGVRRGDEALQRTLDDVLASQALAIRALLTDYGVPLPDAGSIETPASTARTAETTRVAADGSADVAKRNPYTGDPAAVREGEELYKLLNCYSCHGLRGGGGMGPDLTDEEWKEGTGSDVRVMGQIMTGRNKMPGYNGVITEEEAWKVIAYVRTLYKGDPATIEW